MTLVRLVQPENAVVPDAGDAVGDRDAGQAGAARERIVPDAGDAVGDRDAGQAGAAIERIVPDAGDAVGDRDAGQAGAARERLAPMLVTGRPLIVLGMVTAPLEPVYPVMVMVPLFVM